MPVAEPAPAITRPPPGGKFLRRWWVPAALAVILVFAAFVRLRLLDFPLERDEGEYAYAGQLILQGIPPYKLAYNMKLPGTYAAYAGLMAVFGETARGIHLGLILVNSTTVVLVYFLGRSLFGSICGVAAAAFFALLSLSYSVLGLAAHATHFVTLFAVAGALLLWRFFERDHSSLAFWSGLCFGLAFVMKQQGIFFGVFGGLTLLGHEWQERPRDFRRLFRRPAIFAAGMCLPFVIACAALVAAGVFSRFWFWTFSYASQYAALMPVQLGWRLLQSRFLALFQAAPAIWILAGVGFALSLLRMKNQRNAFFVVTLLAASFATVCPGLYFRHHYFIPVLPLLAILAGAVIQMAADEIHRRQWNRNWLIIPLALLITASADAVVHHWAIFFQFTPEAAARAIYATNPLLEAREIGRYIREHSAPGSRIAVLGSEPEIYFYSQRHSATGYIYTYPLMEPHKYALTMQQEMIAEIEAAKPDYYVSVGITSSWLPYPSSDWGIVRWFDDYARNNLEQVGFAEILSLTQTEYHLGDEEGKSSSPHSNFFITLYQRKTTP